MIATWPWIAAAPDPSPAAVAISTPPSPGRRYFTPATSHPTSRDASPAFMTLAMPWWPAESQHSSFHASTGLGPGRWGLLVDPGSWGNLVGGDSLRQAAAHAVQPGEQVAQRKRSSPMRVGGVGAGPKQCLWNGQLPTALRRADGTNSKSTFTAPVIENISCLALLGQQSLEQTPRNPGLLHQGSLLVRSRRSGNQGPRM